ncbi:unnamed protein product [Spirodela intermedia]|uniref:Uncharacterized protein n=1 Tax=Spirodela intermedia TaxID=51605 RepID=A0A7I8LEX0_SPIIN|nr:unnamed protein product [Spirodela intermedia]
MSEALSNLKNSRRRGYRRLGQQLSFNSLNEDDERGWKGDQGNWPKKDVASKGGSKTAHPLLNVLHAPRMDKAMAKPEFLRYLAYLKEAGRWNADANRPVITFD